MPRRLARASVYTIGIGGPSFTPDQLREIATETGGTYRQARARRELASIYAFARERARSDLAAELRHGFAARRHAAPDARPFRAPARRRNRSLSRSRAIRPRPTTPSNLIPSCGLQLGGHSLRSAFSPALLVLLACSLLVCGAPGIVGEGAPRAAPRRRARSRQEPPPTEPDRRRVRSSSTGSKGVFANLKQFRAVQSMIQRADLPLRAGELIAICAGAAFFLGLVLAVAAASPLGALIGMAVGFCSHSSSFAVKATARLRRFENQLPDLLITVAASLKAGHSFRQGIQSAVEEGAEPAAKEFKRVSDRDATRQDDGRRARRHGGTRRLEELLVRHHRGDDPASDRRLARRPIRHGCRDGAAAPAVRAQDSRPHRDGPHGRLHADRSSVLHRHSRSPRSTRRSWRRSTTPAQGTNSSSWASS